MERTTLFTRIAYVLLIVFVFGCGLNNQSDDQKIINVTIEHPDDFEVLVEPPRICSENCEDIQSVDLISTEVVISFDRKLKSSSREEFIKKLEEKWKVFSCESCEDDLILVRSDVPITPEETFGQGEDEVEDEEDLLKLAQNININIGDPNLSNINIASPPDECVSPDNEVLIAIVDGGISFVSSHIWSNQLEVNGIANQDDDNNCFVDDLHGYDFTGENPNEISQHGAILAHLSVDLIPNHSAGIIDLRIFGTNGKPGSLFDALCAMNYARDKGVRILNLSWGYYSPARKIGELTSYDKLLLYYLQHKVGNSIVIASAGNDAVNTDVCYHFPSGFSDIDSYDNTSHIISVTAVDANNQQKLSIYANCGPKTVTIAAVGEYVTAGGHALRGTSYAVPRVANAALKLMTECSGITNDEVREKILMTTGDLKIRTGGVLQQVVACQ